MNNYWGTNFPAWQGGDYTFRYVLTSGAAIDPAEANRFGTEAMTPLETTQVPQGSAQSQLPLGEAALLELDNPNVSLSTWKIADDGEDTVLRLQETAGRTAHVQIQSKYFKFIRGWMASVLEDRLSEIPIVDGHIDVTLRPFQTVTLRVETTVR